MHCFSNYLLKWQKHDDDAVLIRAKVLLLKKEWTFSCECVDCYVSVFLSFAPCEIAVSVCWLCVGKVKHPRCVSGVVGWVIDIMVSDFQGVFEVET